jgi:hypothetical protein
MRCSDLRFLFLFWQHASLLIPGTMLPFFSLAPITREFTVQSNADTWNIHSSGELV